MMSESSRILVVLPTLGERLDTLDRACRSVGLEQQGFRVTLVMVAPRDAIEAKRIAKKYGATVVDDPGKGMSAAINAGLAVRTDEDFYIWLGDDDFYRPGGLGGLLTLMDENPRAVVAYGACDYVDNRERVLWTNKSGRLARFLLGFGPNLIPHPASLIRVDALERVGGYDESLHLAMDLDLFLKLKGLGPFVSTRLTVSAFGWHSGSLSVHDRKKSIDEARLLKRSHLSNWLRIIEPLWEYPVSWMSQFAARQLSRTSTKS